MLRGADVERASADNHGRVIIQRQLRDTGFFDTDAMLDVTVKALKPFNLDPGDKIVITAGVPFGRKATTNLIQVHSIMANGELGTGTEDE